MLTLDRNDIDRLKTLFGYSQDPVTIPRELYDALLGGYVPRETRRSLGLGGLALEVRELSGMAGDNAR